MTTSEANVAEQGTGGDDSIRKMTLSVMIMAAAVVICAISAAVAINTAVGRKTVVVGATDAGRFIPAISLNSPYLNESRVVAVASEALMKSFAHDFMHYRETVTEAQNWYTPLAAESYTKAMDPLLLDLDKRRMVMSVVIERAPVVVKAYLDPSGAYTWDIQARVQLQREGQRERVMPASYIVKMTLTRVPLDVSVRGVLVSSIGMEPVN